MAGCSVTCSLHQINGVFCAHYFKPAASCFLVSPAMVFELSSSPMISAESFLRITSISVAAYDYLITLPTEWKLYSSSIASRRLSVNTVLFILIRYISFTALVASNVGYFYEGFSKGVCKYYYLLAPICKLLQIMVSQTILGVRTYAISRRSKSVGYFLIVFSFVSVGLQWFTDLWSRVPIQNRGNCISGNKPGYLTNWSFYVVAMVFDIVTLGMSTILLLKSASDVKRMSELIRMMLYDGLGYFVVLTCANILNLILYRASNVYVQSAGASFGYMVVWIMSQRLIIHVQAAVADRFRQPVMMAHELSTARDVADAMRSQFTSNKGEDSRNISSDLDVQVQIERAVRVEYDASYSYRNESYSKPKLIWDSRPKT